MESKVDWLNDYYYYTVSNQHLGLDIKDCPLAWASIRHCGTKLVNPLALHGYLTKSIALVSHGFTNKPGQRNILYATVVMLYLLPDFAHKPNAACKK